MLKRFQEFYERAPLAAILWLGLIFRLISVFFSKGYGMHDDHFLVIEAAESWAQGFDYNNWLPGNTKNGEPTGHSFFYVGLHYLFFKFCQFIGFTDPEAKMFVVRLFHAIWSMLTIYFGYRITEKLTGKDEARIVGMLLALFWFYPILSVRTMVEMVCVPFMMLSFWYLLKSEKTSMKEFAIAGLFMGLSIGVRIQTYLIWGGIGLVLLFNRQILGAVIFGITSVVALFFTQITDLIFWGRPFAEMSQYIFYNSSHYDEYITQKWYQYILLLFGLLIPPVSLFLMFGFFKSWKKLAIIFVPTIIFLVFHSIYPNKQERFILPIIPLFIIAGIIGWRAFYLESSYWKNRPKLYSGFIKFFWILNTIALVFASPAATKKSRVESMYKLSKINDVSGIVLDRMSNYGCYLMPRYYHGEWKLRHLCYSKNEIKKLENKVIPKYFRNHKINYCLFIEEKDIDSRIEAMKEYFPDMEFVEKVEPSYIDKLLHFLNPINANENIYIYKLY